MLKYCWRGIGARLRDHDSVHIVLGRAGIGHCVQHDFRENLVFYLVDSAIIGCLVFADRDCCGADNCDWTVIALLVLIA